jgi:hypothetical protein
MEVVEGGGGKTKNGFQKFHFSFSYHVSLSLSLLFLFFFLHFSFSFPLPPLVLVPVTPYSLIILSRFFLLLLLTYSSFMSQRQTETDIKNQPAHILFTSS